MEGESKMKTNKRVLSVLVLLIIIMIASCTSNDTEESIENISFVLDWTPNTNHTGVYVAIAKGYYRDAGLNVKILSPPEAGAPAFVANGNAQFGVDFQESLGIGLTLPEPFPITAVAAIISHNNSGIISLPEKGIDDFSKLEGKVYASWGVPAELKVLEQTMADAGGDFSKLRTFDAPAEDALSMISTGLVDAVWVYESWDVVAADVSGLEYNFIKFAETSPVLDYYTPVIIANDAFLNEHPETARKFIQATAAGYEYAIAHPVEAAQILIDAVPELPPELIFASQEILSLQYASGSESWGFIDSERWGAFYGWMYEQEIIPRPLGSRGFTNEFLLP